jgi:hypothetical protein
MNVSSVFAATTTYTFSSFTTGSSYKNKDIIENVLVEKNLSSVTIKELGTGVSLSTVNVKSDTSVGNTLSVSNLSKYALLGSNDKTITVEADEGSTVGIYYFSSDSNGYASNKLREDALKVNGTAIDGKCSKTIGDIQYYETKLTSDSITFGTANRLGLFGITVTPENKNSDRYNWTVDTNGLDITASEITFGSGSTTDTFSNTLSYKGTKYTVKSIPTLEKDVAGVSCDEGTTIDDTEYKEYNVTVTLQDDWFTAKPTYTVSGTIYNSAKPTEPVANATVTTGTTTVTTSEDGKFTVSGIIGDATLTFSATGYADKAYPYSQDTSDVVVDLVPKTINDGTTTATANKAYARSEFTATTDDNIDYFNGYEINGFKFTGESGKIKLQMVDSQNHTTGDGKNYVGRFNLNTGDNNYISYTPSEAGTLTIVGKTGSNGATDRGVVVKKGSTEVKKINYTSDDMITDTVDVDADTEYKIFAITKPINIYELTFTPSAIEIDSTVNNDANTTGAKVAYVKADGSYYAVVAIEAESEEAVKKIKNVVLSVGGKAIVTIEEVYESIQFSDEEDDDTYTASDIFAGLTGYVYGFKIDGTDNDTTDDAVKTGIGKIVATVNTNSTDAE